MKTIPYAHQKEEFEFSKDMLVRGIFWEMGLGKSKAAIDTACHLYEKGEIDCLVVLAPNGVHTNWMTDEMPKHAWTEDWNGFCWASGKSKTQKAKRDREEVLEHEGLLVITMNYDAVNTDLGHKYILRVLKERSCMIVLDESARIKTPGAKRTKRVQTLAQYAKYRRIMTGTPVTNSPFDVYSQLLFLDPKVWDKLGCRRFATFKAMFGVFKRQHFAQKQFDQLVGYRNLDKLQPIVSSYCTRLKKEDVLDLPPKVYNLFPVEMSAEQSRIYEGLRKDFLTILDGGEVLDAPLAIVRLLRLQQILCGYLPSGDENVLKPLKSNPRIKALMELLTDVSGQAIVWARFQKDIDLIEEALKAAKITYATYDGRTSDAGRLLARQRFRKGDAQIFLANPAAAGEGLTLTEATTVVYYNNSFKLDHRLQSEDRAHRIGQAHSVSYYDLVVPGTIDEDIVAALRNKMNLASKVTGETLSAWLR
jgi:SNF2 family DNA or RNA helicase